MLQIEEGLNHEVLAVINEAYASFPYFLLRKIWAVTEFNVLTGCHLTLLLNLLAIYFIAHLVTVGESVVLADFAKNVSLAHLCRDERLFKLETFFLDAFRHIDLRVEFVSC